jgi:alkylation response protein AidB-like acyl-CoA dehydrogenase
MNFEKSHYHNDIADLVREILSRQRVDDTTADPGFDRTLWSELAKAGVLSAALPESVGGAGLGLVEQCAVLTELGRVVAPAPYLASIVLGASAIAEFGTDEQRRRWAEPAARGELLLTAALQEDTAEDPRSPATTATRAPLTASPSPSPDVSLAPTTRSSGIVGANDTLDDHEAQRVDGLAGAAGTLAGGSADRGTEAAAEGRGTGTHADADERGAEQRGAEQRGAEQRGAEQRGAEQRGAEQRGAEQRGAAEVSRDVGVRGWVLSGVKTAVWAAPWADAMLVPAATADGVTVFVVERSDAGVTVEAQELTDGVTAGRVVLDDVLLDDDRLLGARRGPRSPIERGQGAPDPVAGTVAGWLGARGTVGLCALQLGVTERALELTAEHARNRVQFGRPIGSFQAVAQRLADAWIDVEAIRLTLWQAAWLLSEGRSGSSAQEIDTAVATAKFWAADAGHRVAHTAVHVHGGLGIDTSYLLNRYFAAAKHHEFALGGAVSQLRRIGAKLAKSL